jgi:hypothetical protein
MAGFEHRWLQSPHGYNQLPLDDVRTMDAIVVVLNSPDVGGSGWRYAGMVEGFIILVRKLPPPGALTVEQAMAEADADALGPAKSRKK